MQLNKLLPHVFPDVTHRRRDDYYGSRDAGQPRSDYDYYARDGGGGNRGGGDYYDYFYRRSPPPPGPPRDPYYYDRGTADPYYRGDLCFMTWCSEIANCC